MRHAADATVVAARPCIFLAMKPRVLDALRSLTCLLCHCVHAAKPATDIEGSWRLVFSTATSSRFMQYIPVQEDFVIQLGNKYCALESVVGPFNFVISGKINSWDAATGVMDFQFTAVDILLFGNKVS